MGYLTAPTGPDEGTAGVRALLAARERSEGKRFFTVKATKIHTHICLGRVSSGRSFKPTGPSMFPGLIPVLALLLAPRGQSDPRKEWNRSLSLSRKMQVKSQRET